ncbi:MAG: acetyl-CoA carboxylase biotin carboxyl carrier protein [Planctomycetia bacterium]|nr:acetyl-CoA carboxylase biotin carboxyl carrier protein [Planctomycetia bacterium]
MADEKRDAPRPFDVRTVEYLLRLMSEHDLAEIDLKEGDQRIRLRKGGMMPHFSSATQPVVAAAPPTVAHSASPAVANPKATAPTAPASPPPAPAKKFVEIKSELVGTFYTRPAPGKPEFVKVGSKVKPDTTVCLVVAMKVNNEIKAHCSGTIVEVVAKEEDFVEYGTVLFRVDPS